VGVGARYGYGARHAYRGGARFGVGYGGGYRGGARFGRY
jgi:hypothetical protein